MVSEDRSYLQRAEKHISSLPIREVLEDLLSALDANSNAVIVAPPGAGKTTSVPLALLDADWRRDGKIIVLEPRRLAARAAARRMAQMLSEEVGRTVGYRVRMDTKVSNATRIEVVTEGVFTTMALNDPELSGVAGIVFDEFHERSLDGDFGLALALDIQSGLREDLRIVPMSATLDGAGVATLLGPNTPLIESKGRAFPIDIRYESVATGTRIEAAVIRAVVKTLNEESGSILVFLPGQGEIRRVAERLATSVGDDVDVAPLYGALDAKAQDLAIRPAAVGRRKVVLATSIAETSITIDGVRVVIDSGLARVPKFEPSTGLTRLETVRASRAANDQRAGRAGRTQAGIAIRLWPELQNAALEAFTAPEIFASDLSGLVLDLAAWGVSDPATLRFSDAPPKVAFSEAKQRLTEFSALDQNGSITAHGKLISKLPLPPQLAHMVIEANRYGLTYEAAILALLVTERGAGGNDVDLMVRLDAILRGGKAASRITTLATRITKTVTTDNPPAATPSGKIEPGALLAVAFPDRVAENRGNQKGSDKTRFRLANGRGAEIENTHSLSKEPYIVVADLTGKAAAARILSAVSISRTEVEILCESQITEEDVVEIETSNGAVKANRKRMLGALTLSSATIQKPSADAIEQALIGLVRNKGLNALPFKDAAQRLRSRMHFVHQKLQGDWPDLSDEHLLERLDVWLSPFLVGKTSLAQISVNDLVHALKSLLSYEQQKQLDDLAPRHLVVPTGSEITLSYETRSGETVAVLSIRVQELYGLDQHPMVLAGNEPVLLELCSPAQRPIQLTRDLAGFWRGSWRDVRTEMKGRYPKHFWPEDPANAEPTRRAKPKGQ